MRVFAVLVTAALFAASPSYAADELKFAPAPAWVTPQKIPTQVSNAPGAPLAVLLNDNQVRLEPGKATSFVELALKIQTPEGLAAGNITFPWQPATDTVTVNKLHIIRDGEVIDILKSGQTFTVARRETNMETAMLDGTLTANIQPEGLQVGDIIDLAVTTEHVDPVMKGHVEVTYGLWNGAMIEKGHVRISWPAGLKLVTKQTEDLPQPQRSAHDGWKSIELSADAVEPLLLPNGAPTRFQVGRAGEVTDFQSWSDVADLMAPLYREAAVIPKTGPLRDEVEKIRQSTRSEKERAEKALQLVEERVRYVALLMGTGGYVPASAETTWSRRFGDCKAKSALLLALLHELGIDAEPVLVHSKIGDALPERLPMFSYFDHVIVRATIAGKTYWLDGTRSGDVHLDRVPVPDFEWGLPLEPRASLVALVQPPLAEPDTQTRIDIDATAGVFAPAPFKVEQTFRGDGARLLNIVYSKLSGAQADQMMREYWRGRYDYVEIKSVGSSFDKERAELRLSMSGMAKLPWKDSWWYVPGSSIAYNPDFSRAPGRFHDAPFANSFPSYKAKHVAVRLPPGFGEQKLPPPVKEKQAGVEYIRTAAIRDGVFTIEISERSLIPEIPYREAISAAARLKVLDREDVYLQVPGGYRPTKADVAAQSTEAPASADGFVQKGNILASSGKYDEAIAAFTEALSLDPANVAALAARAAAYALKKDSEGAVRDLSELEKLDPTNAAIDRLRGFVEFMANDLAAADATLSKLIENDPRDTYALFQRGLVRVGANRTEEAITDFSAVLALEPSNTKALSNRATAYHRLGDDVKALADTEKALKGGNFEAPLRLLRANIFRAQGKRDLVVKEADLLIEENPSSDYALVAAGKILSAAGQRERAMQAFDRALAISQDAYIYINRAEVRAPSDLAGKMADLNEALKLEPHHPDALALKAVLLLRQQRYIEAIASYDSALANGSGDRLDLQRGRAIALYKSGKINEAERVFADVRSESKEPVDFNNLCWDKATAGILLESAVEDCRRALELRPEAANYIDSLGMALLRLGKLDQALEAYDRAIAKARLAPSLMGRAVTYARKGDMARAEIDRAEALKLDPNIEARFSGYGVEFPRAQKVQASN